VLHVQNLTELWDTTWFLVGARATLLSKTLLDRVGHGVVDLEERRLGSVGGSLVSLDNSGLDSVLVTLAALGTLLTGGLLALELALGLGTVGGLDALVVTSELFADWLALGFGGSTGGVADSGLADGLALGAVVLLARLLGATDGTGGLLAMDSALSARGFLTLHLALGLLANGVAHSGAAGVVTLPLAVGVALG